MQTLIFNFLKDFDTNNNNLLKKAPSKIILKATKKSIPTQKRSCKR